MQYWPAGKQWTGCFTLNCKLRAVSRLSHFCSHRLRLSSTRLLFHFCLWIMYLWEHDSTEPSGPGSRWCSFTCLQFMVTTKAHRRTGCETFLPQQSEREQDAARAKAWRDGDRLVNKRSGGVKSTSNESSQTCRFQTQFVFLHFQLKALVLEFS